MATDLAGVLNEIEAEILTRFRVLEEHHGRVTSPPLLVVTTIPSDTRRLQAIADLGPGLSISVVVLGAWPAGITCHVTPDGRIGAAHDSQGETWDDLPGLTLFTAGARDTADLLSLFAAADTATTETAPAPAATPTVKGNGSGISDQTASMRPPSVTCSSTDGSEWQATTPADTEVTSPSTNVLARRLNPDALPATPADGEIRRRLNPALPTPTTTPPTPAAEVQTSTKPTTTAVELRVFGAVRLHQHQHPENEAGRDVTGAVGPRLRELLAYLTLHPDGVRRDEVVDALWPDTNPARNTNALNAAISRLRRALARATGNQVPDLIRHMDQRLQLTPDLITVDLWRFQAAWSDARASTNPTVRAAAYRQMIDTYRGQFADDIDADWAATPRQSLHRAATDAISGLARILIETDPQQTLDLLDSARTWDPYNEHLYRDIMRLQARLGHVDAIARTLNLLAVRLTEIHVKPSKETIALAAGLQARAQAPTTQPTTNSQLR